MSPSTFQPRLGALLAATVLLAACSAPAVTPALARSAAETPGCRIIDARSGPVLACDTPQQRMRALSGMQRANPGRPPFLQPRSYTRWTYSPPWHEDDDGSGQGRFDFAGAFGAGPCGDMRLSGLRGGSFAIRGAYPGIDGLAWAPPPAGPLVGTAPGFVVPDALDRACLGRVLEYVPDGGTLSWNRGPGSARPRAATPVATYRIEDGRYCRDFYSNASLTGGARQVRGRACRQPDGSWRAVL